MDLQYDRPVQERSNRGVFLCAFKCRFEDSSIENEDSSPEDDDFGATSGDLSHGCSHCRGRGSDCFCIQTDAFVFKMVKSLLQMMISAFQW